MKHGLLFLGTQQARVPDLGRDDRQDWFDKSVAVSACDYFGSWKTGTPEHRGQRFRLNVDRTLA
jgi:hypothetical protein